MTRRLEQGSVVGFVLIGVLLTAVLVGGVWLARHPIGSSTSQDTSQTTSPDTNNADSTTDEELKKTLTQQAAQSSEDRQDTSSTSTSTSTTSSNLPTTGPTDTLFEMVGAMLLVGTAVAYVRSRSIA